MITKLRVDPALGAAEFGMRCQRLVPWAGNASEPPLGAMACWLDGGRDSEPDCHDQDEIMLVLRGRGELTLGGERTSIDAGDLVVLPRNQRHIVHNTTGEPLAWLSVYWPLREPGTVPA